MAFLRTARALVTVPKLRDGVWDDVRVASGSTRLDRDLVKQASDILGESFDPSKYLLTHATLVASVDTVATPGTKLGMIQFDGQKINRKYADFRVKADCEKWINNNCFIPGTSITMSDGTVKPIEQVQVGDEVLTHTGRARKVLQTYSHQVDGALLGLKYRGCNERLYVTREHPFFVFRPQEACIQCGSNIHHASKCISHLLDRFYCSGACYYSKRIPKRDLLTEKRGEFVPVGQVRDHWDFVATPILDGDVSVGLTQGQARLLGLFLAEGYYELDSRKDNERVGVCFAFNLSEENTLAKTVCSLLKSEFGADSTIRYHQTDKGIVVTTKTNRPLVEFFSRWVLGDGSKTKSLHEDLLRASHQVQEEVVKGWFEGDGSFFTSKIGDARLTGSSASVSLINQVRLILHRLGVAPQWTFAVLEGRKRLVVDGKPIVVSDPTKETQGWTLSCGAGYLNDLLEGTKYEGAYAAFLESHGEVQKVPDLRFLNGYCLQIVESVEVVEYQGKVHNLEVEEDNSYIAGGIAVHNSDAWSRPVLLKSYPTLIGAHSFVEHVQIEELSKGRIIDAVARDIGPSVYVDILVANDRKHVQLIQDIESGALDSLSMGCTTQSTTCTKCGNWASDETEFCNCIRHLKGNIFFDEMGQRHQIAELCGHETEDATGGVVFVEGSWVKIPAFTGAVARGPVKVVGESAFSPSGKKMFSIPKTLPKNDFSNLPEGLAKAASSCVAQEFEDEGVDAPATEPAPEAKPDPLKDMEDELYGKMLDRVKKRVQDAMNGGSAPYGNTNPAAPSSDAPNDTLVSQASVKVVGHTPKLVPQATLITGSTPKVAQYKATVQKLVRTASSDNDFIFKLEALNNSQGIKIASDLYKVAGMVGSPTGFRSLTTFLQACEFTMGREPTTQEATVLVRMAKLLALREKSTS